MLCPHNQTCFTSPGQLETQLAPPPPGYQHHCRNPVPWAHPPYHADQGVLSPEVILEILLKVKDIVILVIGHPED